jgi:hypothetical protein
MMQQILFIRSQILSASMKRVESLNEQPKIAIVYNGNDPGGSRGLKPVCGNYATRLGPLLLCFLLA